MFIESYGKIYTIGHNEIKDIFKSPIVIEEKLDGSQFSFGIINGKLCCRSKNVNLDLDNPEKMFKNAVDIVKDLSCMLLPNYVYRGEYFSKPKHNILAYDRIPNNNIILFDISVNGQNYLSYNAKKAESERIGLECAPKIFEGEILSVNDLTSLLNHISILGGTKIEGVVVKNYNFLGSDGNILMGKYVSEDFKEVRKSIISTEKYNKKDFIDTLIENYRTPARWLKALQHLKEQGDCEFSTKDIGKLIAEIQNDVNKECNDEIKNLLFFYFWPIISRGIVKGVPQWYKNKLLDEVF